MNDRDPESEKPKGLTGLHGPKRRTGRVVRSVQAAVIAALSIAILLTVGFTLVAGLFASGNSGLSRQIVGEINRAIGTDSTRFAGDRIRGTLLRGAIVEN